MFHNRYKMGFDEFKQKRIIEEFAYIPGEEDYCDWELPIDGIKTISVQLKKLAKYS